MSDVPLPSPARAALGAAIRQLEHDVVGHEADEALVVEITRALQSFSGRIATGPRQSRARRGFHEHWETNVGEGERVESFEYRPFSGDASPWSVEPDIRRRGDGVAATVTFGSAHEGAPDRCHGGIVAGLFDDVLGSVLSVTGDGAFTGELTIRYVAPVPLHVELVCAAQMERRDGRKLYMYGELLFGDQILSTAKAVFIQPREAATQSTFDPA